MRRRTALAAMATILLSGCAVNDRQTPPMFLTQRTPPFRTRVPSPTPLDPTLFPRIFTPQYYGNWGLDAVHAGNAYVAGLNGAGVTVALIDTGIAGIPALAGQVVEHIDVTSETGVTDEHGTSVAAVIAARTGGGPMEGIAYGAKILDIKASVAGGFSEADLATALNIAAAQGRGSGAANAGIVNLSLGGAAAISPALRSGLDAAVSAGDVIVIAAGNGTGPVGASNPTTLALFATQLDAKGQVIIAGASTQTGALASYSDRAGAGKAFYLVAPGDRIATFDNQGAQISGSGTSYSAPMISGAAAILEQEFPNLTAAKIVQILLRTADPLSTGTADDYGAGLLDLAKAIQPIGPLFVPLGNTVAGARDSMSHSRLSLGSAFGTASPLSLATRQVVALDSYDRGYTVGLAGGIGAARNPITWANGVTNPMPAVSAAARQLADSFGSFGFAFVPGSNGKQRGAQIALGLSSGTVVEFGVHVTPISLAASGFPTMAGLDDNGIPLFVGGETTIMPQSSFVTDGNGASLSHRFSAGTIMIAALSSNAQPVGYPRPIANPNNSLIQLSATTGFAGIDFGAGLGVLSEDRESLGSLSNGALALGNGAATVFMTGMTHWQATPRLEVSGVFTMGQSSIKKAAGVFQQVASIRTTAFAVNAVLADGFEVGDSVGLQIAQPMRVGSAQATLSLPTGIDAAGNIARSIQSVDLAPSGREVDLQMAYRVSPMRAGWAGQIQGFAMAQFQRGHDNKASTEYAIGFRWSRKL